MNDHDRFENVTPSVLPRDERSDRRQLAAPALAVSVMFLVTVLAQLVLVLLVQLFAPWIAQQDWYLIVASNGPMYAIAMPLSLLCYRMSVAEPPQKKKLGVPAFLGLIPICFALTYIGNIIGSVVNEVIATFTGEPVTNELQELSLSLPLWATFLFMGVLAPILEEIFYRKLVIDRLLRFGELPAILISGILFGLIHANFSQFFYAAMLGMVFGYIYIRTGRLRYTVALHMIVNMVGGVYASEMLKMIDMDAMAENVMGYFLQNPLPLFLLLGYYAFIGICFVAAPITIALFWKHIRIQRAENPLTAKEWVCIGVKNPAVWVLAVVIVLMFIL